MRKRTTTQLSKVVAFLLVICMLVTGIGPISARADYQPDDNAGPKQEGEKTYLAAIQKSGLAVVQTNYLYGKGNTVVGGLSYDVSSNTLTMTDYNHPDVVIETNTMGNDFKINLIGTSVVRAVQCYGNYHGAGVEFTGNGTLTINSTKENAYGIWISAEGTVPRLKIGANVTLNVYGPAEDQGFAIYVQDDLSESNEGIVSEARLVSGTIAKVTRPQTNEITKANGQQQSVKLFKNSASKIVGWYSEAYYNNGELSNRTRELHQLTMLGGGNYQVDSSESVDSLPAEYTALTSGYTDWTVIKEGGDARLLGEDSADEVHFVPSAQQTGDPVINMAPSYTFYKGTAISQELSATAAKGGDLTWSKVGSWPEWLTISGNQLTGTPTQTGRWTVTVQVDEEEGGSAQASFVVEVKGASLDVSVNGLANNEIAALVMSVESTNYVLGDIQNGRYVFSIPSETVGKSAQLSLIRNTALGQSEALLGSPVTLQGGLTTVSEAVTDTGRYYNVTTDIEGASIIGVSATYNRQDYFLSLTQPNFILDSQIPDTVFNASLKNDAELAKKYNLSTVSARPDHTTGTIKVSAGLITEAESGTLTGKVINTSGAAIEGAFISFSSGVYTEEFINYSTTSASDGSFSITGIVNKDKIAAGTIWVSKAGYTSYIKNGSINVQDETVTLSEARSLTVKVNASADVLELLAPEFTIDNNRVQWVRLDNGYYLIEDIDETSNTLEMSIGGHTYSQPITGLQAVAFDVADFGVFDVSGIEASRVTWVDFIQGEEFKGYKNRIFSKYLLEKGNYKACVTANDSHSLEIDITIAANETTRPTGTLSASKASAYAVINGLATAKTGENYTITGTIFPETAVISSIGVTCQGMCQFILGGQNRKGTVYRSGYNKYTFSGLSVKEPVEFKIIAQNPDAIYNNIAICDCSNGEWNTLGITTVDVKSEMSLVAPNRVQLTEDGARLNVSGKASGDKVYLYDNGVPVGMAQVTSGGKFSGQIELASAEFLHTIRVENQTHTSYAEANTICVNENVPVLQKVNMRYETATFTREMEMTPGSPAYSYVLTGDMSAVYEAKISNPENLEAYDAFTVYGNKTAKVFFRVRTSGGDYMIPAVDAGAGIFRSDKLQQGSDYTLGVSVLYQPKTYKYDYGTANIGGQSVELVLASTAEGMVDKVQLNKNFDEAMAALKDEEGNIKLRSTPGGTPEWDEEKIMKTREQQLKSFAESLEAELKDSGYNEEELKVVGVDKDDADITDTDHITTTFYYDNPAGVNEYLLKDMGYKLSTFDYTNEDGSKSQVRMWTAETYYKKNGELISDNNFQKNEVASTLRTYLIYNPYVDESFGSVYQWTRIQQAMADAGAIVPIYTNTFVTPIKTWTPTGKKPSLRATNGNTGVGGSGIQLKINPTKFSGSTWFSIGTTGLNGANTVLKNSKNIKMFGKMADNGFKHTKISSYKYRVFMTDGSVLYRDPKATTKMIMTFDDATIGALGLGNTIFGQLSGASSQKVTKESLVDGYRMALQKGADYFIRGDGKGYANASEINKKTFELMKELTEVEQILMNADTQQEFTDKSSSIGYVSLAVSFIPGVGTTSSICIDVFSSYLSGANDTAQSDALERLEKFNKKFAEYMQVVQDGVKDVEEENEQKKKASGGSSASDDVTTNATHDPSGIVYEAVLSNPVAGATTTLYTSDKAFAAGYKPKYDGLAGGTPTNDISGLAGSVLQKFDIAAYLNDGQSNDLVTAEDGRYQWYVPEGLWYVKASKAGYEEGTSQKDKNATVNTGTYNWLPVLPVQLNVNIPLVSKAAPTVEEVQINTDGIYITFSKYMDESTLRTENFKVTDASGDPVDVIVEKLDSEQAPDNINYSDPAPSYTRHILLKRTSGAFTVGEKYSVVVQDALESYADVKMYDSYVSGEIPAAVKQTVSTPVFDHSGLVEKNTPVEISTSTEGAKIYYTTDGSAPTTASRLYTAPISIREGMTIKAIAVKPGYNESAVASAVFTVKTYKPELPGGGGGNGNTGNGTGGGTSGGYGGGGSTGVPGKDTGKNPTYKEKISEKADGRQFIVRTDHLAEGGEDIKVLLVRDSEGQLIKTSARIITKKETISAACMNRVKEMADSGKINVRLQVNNIYGKTRYELSVSSENLVPNKTLYVYQYNSKTGRYTLVKESQQKVKLDQDGNLSLKLPKLTAEDMCYRCLNAKDKKLADKKILKTIRLQNTQITLKAGKKEKLAFTASYDKANVKKVAYSSDNPKIAKVDKRGTIKAIAKGKTTITVKVTLQNGKTKKLKEKVTVV